VHLLASRHEDRRRQGVRLLRPAAQVDLHLLEATRPQINLVLPVDLHLWLVLIYAAYSCEAGYISGV